MSSVMQSMVVQDVFSRSKAADPPAIHYIYVCIHFFNIPLKCVAVVLIIQVLANEAFSKWITLATTGYITLL